ncbi:MAG: glutathione S-transferase family protein [Rubrivivax sp.]
MAEYTFFTNPMSRARIARWALHEAGADYTPMAVDWAAKPAALLQANPMGKLPTIIHHAPFGDRVVTEAAAVCCYLAEAHPAAALLPDDRERADYWRWLFFAAGPIEHAVTSKALGFAPTAKQEAMVGFGNAERAIGTLEAHLADRAFVCGDRFTMADVYVGSAVDWGLMFKTMPERPAFVAYAERLRARPAYRDAKAIDDRLIEELKR